MTIVSASAGAYTHLFTNLLRGGGLLYGLLGFGLAMALYATPDNGKNRSTRMALLLGFAFFSGLGTGPLLDMALMINPSLIPNAFLLSGVIFACFSGAALFAPDGQYLYLGGTLLSGLSTLFWLGFLNLFFQSQLIFQVRFYNCLSERSWMRILGLLVGRTLAFLRIHHVGHSNDHWEEATRRQRLHRSFPWPLYWLYASLQKSLGSFDAKGKPFDLRKFHEIINFDPFLYCFSKGSKGN